MRRAMALAALAALGTLAGAESATATLVCPAGVTNPAYCTNVTPPAASTGAASEVTPESASLSGTVTTYGAATTYYFQYGTTTAYGQQSSTGSLPAAPGQPASATTTDVQAAIAGLSPSTTYHYRLLASNAGGTTVGEDQTFTTPDAAGLVVVNKAAIAALGGNRVILVPLHCSKKPRCKGTLLALPLSSASARARSSSANAVIAATVDGRGTYSVPYGSTGHVRVALLAPARAALARTGRLTVRLVAVSDGVRTTLGAVTIRARAARRPRHVTHARTRPGFTG
ncbi:MAG: hypothetical protein ACTHM1_08155 [Solirubrobacteraceae bacterium]